jgi:uncharacterized protein (DUF2164 family)
MGTRDDNDITNFVETIAQQFGIKHLYTQGVSDTQKLVMLVLPLLKTLN